MKPSTLLTSLILTALALPAIAEEKVVPAKEVEPPCCHEEEATDAAAGSLYQLDAKWTNQHGKEVKLSDFKGRPVLLTMGYASCKFACPRLVADLMAVERSLTDAEKKQVAFVFVSIDPARDTPENLATFFKQYNVDQTRWSGLRGDEDGVLEMSVAIGTRYRKIDNNDFAHSNTLTLLSPSGEIAHQQQGLGTDPAETIAAMRKLLAK